ncbi:MAG: hypothetical protein WCC92_18105 [Candidatus Korobacteraceae bacterium]
MPVLVFSALQRIALFMSPARWMDALYWFRVAQVRSGLVGCNLPTEPERELLPPVGLKAIWKSRHQAGADQVLLSDGSVMERIRASAPNGIDHIVEVAFAANINADVEMLAQGGSIATYASNAPKPEFLFGNLSSRTRECFSSAAMTFRRRQSSKPRAISMRR